MFAAIKPVSHKATELHSQTAVEKSIDDSTKSANQDEFTEEIADDLSEISDEADDILGQQEVCSHIDGSFLIISNNNNCFIQLYVVFLFLCFSNRILK